MEKKKYLVGVTIIEARGLEGKDASGTSDPFVRITCANEAPQVSKKRDSTLTAIWNQSFTFDNVELNDLELETLELMVEVLDHNSVMFNEVIGSYSIGLSTMYRAINHEFYRVWLTLFNPKRPSEV